MPLAGKGMLLTSMDVDASDEREFNAWYDREHLEERVAIDGFLEARRYVAQAATPKYLSLYSTETFAVLDSPAYRTALANQTAPAPLQTVIAAVAPVSFTSNLPFASTRSEPVDEPMNTLTPAQPGSRSSSGRSLVFSRVPPMKKAKSQCMR